MGGCYSCASHKVLVSPAHKQPRERRLRLSRKGLQYTAVSSEGARQPNPTATGNSLPGSAEDVSPLVDLLLPKEAEEERGVVASDSGVESLGSPQEQVPELDGNPAFSLCRSCHQKLKRLTWSSCQQCDKFRFDPTELSALVSNTYCTCGPRQHGKHSDCKTHRHYRGRGASGSSLNHSIVVTTELDNDERKQVEGNDRAKFPRRKIGNVTSDQVKRGEGELSDVCPSDCADQQAPLAVCESVGDRLENNVSEEYEQSHAAILASSMNIYNEVLKEVDYICRCDVSGEAPQDLCVFKENGSSSPKCAEGESESRCETNSVTLSSRLFSPTESSPARSRVDADCQSLDASTRDEEDDDSGHGISKSDCHPGSLSESELEDCEELISSSHLPLLRSRAPNISSDLSVDEEEGTLPVSITIKGRQMVMLDATTYANMLRDLLMLKEQLHLLTEIIQEEAEI